MGTIPRAGRRSARRGVAGGQKGYCTEVILKKNTTIEQFLTTKSPFSSIFLYFSNIFHLLRGIERVFRIFPLPEGANFWDSRWERGVRNGPSGCDPTSAPVPLYDSDNSM